MQGVSRLDKTWRSRMEDSYQTGGDTHPLRGLQKGSKKYTDKFDAENPGGVLRMFRYAQRTIGNQSSYADVASCMNRKADVDGLTVKGNKAQCLSLVQTAGRQGEITTRETDAHARHEDGSQEMVRGYEKVN